MRTWVGAGMVALVAAATGACASLAGLGDYGECAGACGAAGDRGDDMHVDVPDDSSTPSSDDGASPGERGVTPGEGPDDASSETADATSADGPSQDGRTQSEAQSDARVGTGMDAWVDAASEASAPPMTGSTCGPRGTTTRCGAGQVCCATLATQTNSCAASCASNATLGCTSASDCPQSAPICCANAALTNDAQNDPLRSAPWRRSRPRAPRRASTSRRSRASSSGSFASAAATPIARATSPTSAGTTMARPNRGARCRRSRWSAAACISPRARKIPTPDRLALTYSES